MPPSFSDYIIIIAVLLIIVLVVLIGMLYNMYYNLRRQDTKWKAITSSKLNAIQTNSRLNLENKIVALDKLLEYTLQHYFGNYGDKISEILKKQSKSFSDVELDGIWLSRKIVTQLTGPVQYGGNSINLENTVNIYTKYIKKYMR